MLLLTVLPLRVPEDCDLYGQLKEWMESVTTSEVVAEEAEATVSMDVDVDDPAVAVGAGAQSSSNNDAHQQQQQQQQQQQSSLPPRPRRRPEFLWDECHTDVQRLVELRAAVMKALQQGYDAAWQQIQLLQEYAVMLQHFESRGFPSTDAQGMGLEIPWKTMHSQHHSKQYPSNHHHHHQAHVRTAVAFPEAVETHSSLAWERANVIWNLATLHAYQASLHAADARNGWKKAGGSLQSAASLIRYIRVQIVQQTEPFQSAAMSESFLLLWELFTTAEAVRAGYESFFAQSRPKHIMLAKFAAGCASQLQQAEEACQGTAWSAVGTMMASTAAVVTPWEESIRAWTMYMTAAIHLHQAAVHQDANELPQELVRLQIAVKFATLCQNYCESVDDGDSILEGLAQKVGQVMQQLRTRLQDAEQRYSHTVPQDPLPDPEDLPDVPEQSTKISDDVSKLLPALSKPLFTNVMDPAIRPFVELFSSDMNRAVERIALVSDEKLDLARRSLAAVHLPHSLTAYKQELNGGGIPDELWERVQQVRQERKVQRLQQELWTLREMAESARSTHSRVQKLLAEDVEVDGLFRGESPSFAGHDVAEIQKPFRQALRNYDKLMQAAQDSDALLMERCAILDTDPKFQLLSFNKSQLDRLLPGRGMTGPPIDVSNLSSCLVELNDLIEDRETMVHDLRERVRTYKIMDQLQQAAPQQQHGISDPTTSKQEYKRILEQSKQVFAEPMESISKNLDRQAEVLRRTLHENERFMRARRASRSSHASSDSCIVKIEDALEELDLFSRHLREGRGFYEVMHPKLERLIQQVGDVSARLAVERCDFEDRERRSRQEEDDARMAASLNSGSNEDRGSSSSGNRNDNNNVVGNSVPSQSSPIPAYASPFNPTSGRRGTPGVEAISHSQPDIRVNDEMMANLISMGFDAETSYNALRRFDNDFDRALNDLLSG